MQNCIAFFFFFFFFTSRGFCLWDMLGWFLRNAGKFLKLIKRRANIYSPHILGSATCMISECQSLFGFLFVVMCGLQPCLMQTLNNQSVPFFCVEAYSQESNYYYNVNTCCNISVAICADITWLSTLLTTNWLVTAYDLSFRANVPCGIQEYQYSALDSFVVLFEFSAISKGALPAKISKPIYN